MSYCWHMNCKLQTKEEIMKAKNSKRLMSTCLIALQLTIFSAAAFAGKKGGMDGGGGDALIHTATGEVVSLADPLANEPAQGRRIVFSKAVKEELEKVIRHAEGYFFAPKDFDALTSEDNVIYLVTDELPANEICQERIKYKEPGEGYNIVAAACTAGKRTWIKKSIYDQLSKMSSKRELALLLTHEGLRRVPGLSHSDLTTITNGLRETLALYDRQLAGDFTKISEEQKDIITTMMESILLNSLSGLNLKAAKNILERFVVTDYGGLVHNESFIDESAVVGAGSQVKENVNTGKDVKLLGSIFTYNNLTINLNTMKFEYRKEKTITIPVNAKIVNSRVETVSSTFKNSVIENSKLIILDGELKENAVIKNSIVNIYGTVNSNAFFENSTLDVKSVGEKASVKNSKIVLRGSLGKNAEIKDSELVSNDIGDNLKMISSSLITEKDDDGSYRFYNFKIGNNFEAQKSNLVFKEMRHGYVKEIPNDVKFKNTTAKFINDGNSNDLLMLGSFGALSNGELKFQPGLKVDFEGKKVCGSDIENEFKSGKAKVWIKTQEDLVKYCK